MPETPDIVDLAIIGGGINGCGIARDAAGRGLSVVLAEKDDLASGTSSASTKLIHGGLRYLEHYEFRLVRESLIEREVLLRAAPHIIRPMRFILPHHKGLRPRWLIRLGLFLYDHLGGRKLLPGTRTLDLTRDPAGRPLRDTFRHAFEYSDCWVEDARLVVLNAMDAAERGARIHVRTECVEAARERDRWRIKLRDTTTGATSELHARALVNAAGPWVSEVLSGRIRLNTDDRVRLVKGSHIVVQRLFDGDRAYIFQNTDQRIVFAIPYEGDFTLIGTTDEDVTGDPGAATISDGEIAYLCDAVSAYFRTPISRDSIVWTYSGVRPLYDDGSTKAQEATRDYVLRLDAPKDAAPLLSIFGGKITTSRRLAEEALEELAPHLANGRAEWTAAAALPGGDFPVDGATALKERIRDAYPFLTEALAARLARAYGTRVWQLLGKITAQDQLGEHFGAELYELEVAYLMRHEWARTADDVLWRRSKLGLRLSKAERDGLRRWMEANAPA
ncbi:MAG: glycerol-3-phosphate dehydrogenase [Methyloligellaceae bacterium]